MRRSVSEQLNYVRTWEPRQGRRPTEEAIERYKANTVTILSKVLVRDAERHVTMTYLEHAARKVSRWEARLSR